jgi:predicted HAD superfamily Cof-like phosphohydrolase
VNNNDAQMMVRDFHQAMSVPVQDTPAMYTPERGALRVALIREEASEFAEAVQTGNMVECIDALCDLAYVVYGAALELGVVLDPFFREVHRANMDKAGGPVRDDGKILKPEGWQPPDIAGVLRTEYPLTQRDFDG